MSHPEDHAEALLRNLHDHTGRSLADWLALLQHQHLPNQARAVQWLKEVHHMGHFYATFIAIEAFKVSRRSQPQSSPFGQAPPAAEKPTNAE